ncbi:MAG: hypothetical protein ABIR80_00675 [Opitutaceae bacterium]
MTIHPAYTTRRSSGIAWPRALLAWLAIVLAETVHGVLRGQLLVPLVGDLRTRQMGVFAGSLLIFGIAWLSIRWIGAWTTRSLFAVGAAWLALTLLFEIGLGRLVLGYPWTRIVADYDPRQGGLLTIGMVFLVFTPLLAAKLRGITPCFRNGG